MEPRRVQSLTLTNSGLLTTKAELDAMLKRWQVGSTAELLLPEDTAGVQRLMDLAYHHPPKPPHWVLQKTLPVSSGGEPGPPHRALCSCSVEHLYTCTPCVRLVLRGADGEACSQTPTPVLTPWLVLITSGTGIAHSSPSFVCKRGPSGLQRSSNGRPIPLPSASAQEKHKDCSWPCLGSSYALPRSSSRAWSKRSASSWSTSTWLWTKARRSAGGWTWYHSSCLTMAHPRTPASWQPLPLLLLHKWNRQSVAPGLYARHACLMMPAKNLSVPADCNWQDTLILWGRHDEVFPVAIAERMKM